MSKLARERYWHRWCRYDRQLVKLSGPRAARHNGVEGARYAVFGQWPGRRVKWYPW